MILGVAVTKGTSWRGIAEEFTNVYHYDTSTEVTSEQVLNGIVNAERQVFGSNVSYLRGQVYGPADGTILQNQMLLQKDLTGVGAVDTGSITAKELTAVVSWDTGRVNTRGGRIYLRKYLHIGRIAITDEDQAKGNGPLTQNVRDMLESYGNAAKNVVGVSGASLCDKKGRKLPLGTNPVVLPHLHTRQFRR
jgi:hypothetical protein